MADRRRVFLAALAFVAGIYLLAWADPATIDGGAGGLVRAWPRALAALVGAVALVAGGSSLIRLMSL